MLLSVQFQSSAANDLGLRKGVGNAGTVRRPRYNLTLLDPEYFAKAGAMTGDDFVKRGMVSASKFGEPTFVAAGSRLTPPHDYAIIGNVESHTKFSIAQDGRVRLANFSIYSPMLVGNQTEGGELGILVFDPRLHLDWWPLSNFSEYKCTRTPEEQSWHMS